jgi:hypothetical protein
MNFSINSITIPLAILSAPMAHAEREVGNGGNAVVCRAANQEITSAHLLDYVEGMVLNDFVVDLGPPALSVEEKLDLAISRLAELDPARAQGYRSMVPEIPGC